MSKTLLEIKKELNETEVLYNNLAMEIGTLYARYKTSDNPSLMNIINDKVEEFKKAEQKKKELEEELRKHK